MAQQVKNTLGKTKAAGTFQVGTAADKKPLGGSKQKSNDLRAKPGKNQGGMPSHM